MEGGCIKLRRCNKIILVIIINISGFVMALCAIFGIIDSLLGAGFAERLLQKMNIPLSYASIYIIGMLSATILLVSRTIYLKTFKNNKKHR